MTNTYFYKKIIQVSANAFSCTNGNVLDYESSVIITVKDCVEKCQKILGLKIHEIAKLAKVSRVSLDLSLHHKGHNINDMQGYINLYVFVSKIETLYGNKLKDKIRNILVGRKTLIQHLQNSTDNLELTFPLIATLANKVDSVVLSKKQFDESKLMLRTRHIGNMG